MPHCGRLYALNLLPFVQMFFIDGPNCQTTGSYYLLFKVLLHQQTGKTDNCSKDEEPAKLIKFHEYNLSSVVNSIR